MHKFPDRWLIIKIGEDVYKVFATWTGGYNGADAWLINSGIVKVDEDEQEYRFYGYSGSCYHCKKNAYGSTGYGLSVLSNMFKQLDTEIIAQVCDDRKWTEFFTDKL